MRLLILIAVLVGLGAARWSQARQAYKRLTAEPPGTWFAPYVDVTLTPQFHFEDPRSPALTPCSASWWPTRRPCLPTWGTYYDLDGAGPALDLDRRITRLRQRGGDVIVSFGGAANTSWP